jgi:hypothetical protein
VPSPELAAQLSDLGGFALFLLFVLTAAVGLWKQWWVPGWLYRQERDARLTAETQALRNADALQKVAKAMTSDRPIRRVRGASDVR